MPDNAANPLLHLPFRVPFDEIRAEHVQPAVSELLGTARAGIDALAAGPAPRTFNNTLSALDTITEPLDEAMAVVRHLESVATYPELRAAYNAVQPEVSAFYSGIPMHAGLWRALQSYAGTDEARTLTGTHLRFLTKTIDSFRRHGAELDAEGKARLEALDIELSTLTTKFAENVLDATNAFELIIPNESGLMGLPPSAVDAARESAAGKGIEGWRFTLQAPSYIPVMMYLDDAGIRERMYHGYSTRASVEPHDNRPLLGRILELRRAKADLLGFRNRELLEFRRSLEGPAAPELQPWDVAYYAEKQRAALYNFDEEALRPYFPLERVVDGLFEIAHRLYGIRVSDQAGVPVWDPQVHYYAVYDGADRFIGGFYADWYPRENKRGGAWMDAIMTGYPTAGGFRPHLGLICGNLTPPLAGKPALLTHQEVTTIFHEFGHLLHHLLSRVDVRCLPRSWKTGAGTASRWTCSRVTTRPAIRFRKSCSAIWCAPGIFAARTARCASLVSGSWIWRCTSPTRPSATGTSSPTRAACCNVFRRLRCRRITPWWPASRTCSRAPSATAPATTRTSGPRCWTRMPSRCSARAASSARRWARSSAT
jgi:oligopeptidase A